MAMMMMNHHTNHHPHPQPYHQQPQPQPQPQRNGNSTSTSTSNPTQQSSTNAQQMRAKDAAKADAFANLVVFIWFSSWPLIENVDGNANANANASGAKGNVERGNPNKGIGSSTPPSSNKSPTSTFQPLHSSPLAHSRFTSTSFNDTSGATNSIQTGDTSQPQPKPPQPSQPLDEPDQFANSVRRALEEHLSTSSASNNRATQDCNQNQALGGNAHSQPSTSASTSTTSPELGGLDTDADSALRLIPHQRFKTFARDVLTTTQASGPGMALALLYIYRLKSAHPHLKGKGGSEFRIAITALMLSNKALEDHTFTNKSWGEISGIELKDINKMEVEFWLGLGMRIHVSVEDYTQWLSTLRILEERRAHALIKRERDINRRKLAQHHAAIAALQQLQQHQHQQQQQQHNRSLSQQSSPQHPHAYSHDQPFGYPTPPMLPNPVYSNPPRPASSSGILQTTSNSLNQSQFGPRASGVNQQHQSLSQPPTSTSPFSNFSFNARSSEALNRDEGDSEPIDAAPSINSINHHQSTGALDFLSSYQLPRFQDHVRPGSSSSGSGMASGSSSRYQSPEQTIPRQSLNPYPSHHPLHQLQTPVNHSSSRRPSHASSQGSVSSVKRAFNTMQSGSLSPYQTSPLEEDLEARGGRSGSVGPPPNKRVATGLGLSRPGKKLGVEDWSWLSNGYESGNLDVTGRTQERGETNVGSSVSPTDVRAHSRQSSFTLEDGRSRSESIVQMPQFQTSQRSHPSQTFNSRNLPGIGINHHHSRSTPTNPYPYSNQLSSWENQTQQQLLQQHSTSNGASYPQLYHYQQHRTPNMLVRPYTDYDLNSRPQPTELAFYQISAEAPARRTFGTQAAPPLTEWEFANSRRGSFAGGIATGIQTPLQTAYVFNDQSPRFNLGNTTPMGSHIESALPLFTPLVQAPHSSPVVNRSSHQNHPYMHQQHSQPQIFNRNHFYNQHKDHTNHQPHPLSRDTSPINETFPHSHHHPTSRPSVRLSSSLSDSNLSQKRHAEGIGNESGYEQDESEGTQGLDQFSRHQGHDVFGQQIYNTHPSR